MQNPSDPRLTHAFFQHLREANWSVMPWKRARGDPARALFDFITANPQPIFLGQLYERHQGRYIDIFPYFCPMEDTVYPTDMEMATAFAVGMG